MTPAVAWYNRLRKIDTRKADLTFNAVQYAAARSLSLTPEDREAIFRDLVRLQAGSYPCPMCGHEGPHKTNQHHRFGSYVLICTGCRVGFKPAATEEIMAAKKMNKDKGAAALTAEQEAKREARRQRRLKRKLKAQQAAGGPIVDNKVTSTPGATPVTRVTTADLAARVDAAQANLDAAKQDLIRHLQSGGK